MKFDRIYIEAALRSHSRARDILAQSPAANVIECQRYGEVFNPNHQNFREQKRQPSLILAEKHGQRVIPTPAAYGLGGDAHFYFSHMLNCLYDCRYCFLQGMYRSANYVLFPNYEDFMADIDAVLAQHPGQRCFFFSGYDCDSLAMDSLTGFVDSFLPFFAERHNGYLELRTKSVNTSPLLERDALPNVIVAYSLNPAPVAKALEHRAPPTKARLKAMAKLAEAGWPIGIRLDPMILYNNWEADYEALIDEIFATIPSDRIHSITFGTFRSPKGTFKRMADLYPEEPLFLGNLELADGMIGYQKVVDRQIRDTARSLLESHIEADRLFECAS